METNNKLNQNWSLQGSNPRTQNRGSESTCALPTERQGPMVEHGANTNKCFAGARRFGACDVNVTKVPYHHPTKLRLVFGSRKDNRITKYRVPCQKNATPRVLFTKCWTYPHFAPKRPSVAHKFYI